MQANVSYRPSNESVCCSQTLSTGPMCVGSHPSSCKSRCRCKFSSDTNLFDAGRLMAPEQTPAGQNA